MARRLGPPRRAVGAARVAPAGPAAGKVVVQQAHHGGVEVHIGVG